MKKNLALMFTLAATLAAVGCASQGSKDASSLPENPNADTGGIVAGSDASTGTGDATPIAPMSGADTAAASLADKTVYFAYDGVEIDAAGETVVANYGRYLTGTPGSKLRLEGHADERGSREYNVALGERRAQAVARGLKAAGATDAQLSLVSYGEDRPLASGHDEDSYAKNRRVELVK